MKGIRGYLRRAVSATNTASARKMTAIAGSATICRLMRNAAGDPIEVVGSWNDITARKQLGEALVAAQDRIGRLLSSAPAVIYSYKATGDFAPTFVSQNIKDWLGYEPQEYLENADFWRSRVHPDDLAAVEAEVAQLFKKGRHTVEYRFLKKDGTYCWVNDEQRLIRDEEGQPTRGGRLMERHHRA